MYRSRAVDLARDSRLAQLELFGVEGEGETGHAHLQLRALPHGVLSAPQSAARGSEGCPTCDLVAHELQQRVRVVQSGPHAVVLVPFAPLAPVELWVVPRSHAAAAHDASDVVVDAVSRGLAETLPLLDRLAGTPVVVWRLESTFRPGDPGAHWRVIVRTATAHAAIESLSGVEPVLPLSPESVADALRAALGSMA